MLRYILFCNNCKELLKPAANFSFRNDKDKNYQQLEGWQIAGPRKTRNTNHTTWNAGRSTKTAPDLISEDHWCFETGVNKGDLLNFTRDKTQAAGDMNRIHESVSSEASWTKSFQSCWTDKWSFQNNIRNIRHEFLHSQQDLKSSRTDLFIYCCESWPF